MHWQVNIIPKIFMNSKDDGFVYSWGHNRDGQLGHDDTKDRKIPTLIDGLTKIKKIYCGYSHTMAINGNKMWISKIINSKIENDELYVWGTNDCGKLGLGDCTYRLKPKINNICEIFKFPSFE